MGAVRDEWGVTMGSTENSTKDSIDRVATTGCFALFFGGFLLMGFFGIAITIQDYQQGQEVPMKWLGSLAFTLFFLGIILFSKTGYTIIK